MLLIQLELRLIHDHAHLEVVATLLNVIVLIAALAMAIYLWWYPRSAHTWSNFMYWLGATVFAVVTVLGGDLVFQNKK